MKVFHLRYWFLVSLVMVIFMLAGCGGGSSENSADQQERGEIVISMTDAKGDFTAYIVDILSLTLTKANGAQVSTLPLSSSIDFTQYTEMTEFLTAATVPAGVYVAATLTLDYQNAAIWVEDDNGDNVQISTILDDDGNPVTTLEVSVRLEDRNQLLIAPGIPAHLILDFDLKATNQVSFNAQNEPELTVDPFLVADVNRAHLNKRHRLRGLLDDVDITASSFSVFLRPFYCALSGTHHRFGIRTVTVDDQTLFDIDGQQYIGQDGLIALEGLTPLSAVLVFGDLKFNPLRFEAREVYAGSSVSGGTLDVVKGNVISRQGDLLTVKGATLIRNDGSVVFNDQVTIQVGDQTLVTRQLSQDFYDIDDISVGQRVKVFGTLTNTEPESLEMDANQGRVRMLLTTVRGTVISVDETNPTAQLILDLQSINRCRAGIFDFSGTGIDAAHDADPENYEIYTSTIDLSATHTDMPVKVRGFVSEFGQAPPDLNAQTIINVADLKASMKVRWRPPTSTPFESISTERISLSLDGVSRFHHLTRGWVVSDLKDLNQSPSIVPKTGGIGLFVIKLHGVVQVFIGFDDFIEAVQDLLEDGLLVKKLHAVGKFDDATATLTADMIEVRFK